MEKRRKAPQYKRAALLANPGAGERTLERAVAALGFPYERQKPIGPYYADFAVPDLGLVIEVDGKGHGGRRDEKRDKEILDMGWRTIRISSRAAIVDPVAALFSALSDSDRLSALHNRDRSRFCGMVRAWKPPIASASALTPPSPSTKL
jgi:very-short-patch-repair endonuclease